MPKLFTVIQSVLYDSFAYYLGPDDWEKAHREFNQNLNIALDQAVCPNCGDVKENDIYCNHDFHKGGG